MKYIEVEKLKELIDEKWRGLADKNVKVGGGKYDVEISTYLSVLRLIDSIKQEHSEVQNGKFVFPKYLYAKTIDNKTIDVSYAPQSLDAVEYIKNDAIEQPNVDLEKEVRTYCCSSFIFNYDELNDSFYSNAFEFDDAVELARHFYELGQQEMRNRITNPKYNAKVVEQLKSEYPIIKE